VSRLKVGVLGATGMVGQQFVQSLEDHPWFELAAVAASDRSEGKCYGEVCRWRLSATMPASAFGLRVLPCRPDSFRGCRLILSALPGEVAGPVEEEFARAGFAVSSNASAHRCDPDVPLLVPEVNPEHLSLLEEQHRQRGWKGLLVTNPNCSAASLVIALKALLDRFGLEAVMVTTMQALSGAGYPGVPSLDSLDNVVPYIAGEEQKLESEPKRILGKLLQGRLEEATFSLSASCNRVAVRSGHLECVSVRLERKATSLTRVAEALKQFSALPQALGLPSAPRPPILLREEPDRPQPFLDRDEGHGMTVVVGRLRPCPVLEWKFTLLGHNLQRGAAGAALLNAELLLAKGYLG
jgi:aspartate-semialdehyde dehydrogenase